MAKKSFIRIAAVFVTIALLCALLPVIPFAETDGSYEYAVLSDGTAKITAYNGLGKERHDEDYNTIEATVNIPSEINGYKVTVIGESAFEDCYGITVLTIPDSITAIEDKAFHACTYLTEITIPGNVKSIGEDAFFSCYALETLTVNEGVESIGNAAFYGSNKLVNITLPDSIKVIGNNVFYRTGYYNDESNWENDVLYIGNHLIEAKDTISGSYTVKAGTKTIADDAFEYCSNLTEITIPDSVITIGDTAFFRCTSLNDINLPDSIMKMGELPFLSSGAENYWLYNSDDRYDRNGFYADNKYLAWTSYSDENYIVKDGTLGVCDELLINKYVKSVTIPSSVNFIGDYAFGYMDNEDYSGYIPVEGFTVYGYSGTAAEKYAADNSFIFVDLATSSVTPPTDEPTTAEPTTNKPADNEPTTGEQTTAKQDVPATTAPDNEPSETTYQPGDVNSDGKVTASDARMALRFSARLEAPTDEQILRADMDESGNITASDARKILRISAKVDEMPLERAI